MKIVLNIGIEAGERTCASVPGTFCKHTGVRGGIKPQHCCRLFPDVEVSYTDLIDLDGWLQRCDSCLTAERN